MEQACSGRSTLHLSISWTALPDFYCSLPNIHELTNLVFVKATSEEMLHYLWTFQQLVEFTVDILYADSMDTDMFNPYFAKLSFTIQPPDMKANEA